ncbi:MAG: alanine racemase [Gemmatimonadota bacterium]|nr:alanine racemase [Gemmatimonadota bacterium]MDH4348336.1 alanine racemase [Gemmatimonadota bacterium]MDH5283110.1 alanine racemase [Gemmatimonadota bacterium]
MTSNPAPPSRAWADIRLGAIIANARTIASISGVRLLPMVKANAYGLGAVPVARALEQVDPWGVGVVTPEEGVELRQAGITRPILVFTPFRPSTADLYLRHELRPVIGDDEGLRAWLGQGSRPFHVEVDTGMSRCGFRWNADLSWSRLLTGAPGFEGLLTHFHSVEDRPASVELQWSRLRELHDALPVRPAMLHAANSAAALRHPAVRGDLVRPGIFLYGGEAGGRQPEPVVMLRARVVALRKVGEGETVSYGATWTAGRDTLVATLGIGYADGVPRSLANRGAVELGGRVVPILGRVTMDFLMVEAPEGTAMDDVAVIFGGAVSLDDQARRAGTISYELLTALGQRLPRSYQS